MSISENYADQMIAARGANPVLEDEGFVGGSLTTLGASGGAVSHVAQGAIKVAVHRDEARILQKLKVMANAAGQRWYYRWPTKNKDGSKGVVEGPSIDCAMAVARLYGNCDVDLRVQETMTHWVFYARFSDFESGFTVTRAYQQRKSQTTGGKMDAERQLDIVFQIGQSKAIRNVIVNALADFADFAFEAAKGSFVERIGNKLDAYREKAVAKFAELGVDIRRVEAIIGKTAKEWLAPDIARIIAELQAINDGMSSADETYPVLQASAEQVSEKEPVKAAEPKTRKPRAKAADQSTADETKPGDGEAVEQNPVDKLIADGEVKAREVTTLTELADLDAEVSDKLAGDDVDPDARTYWRSIVQNNKTRITGR